MFIIFLSKLTSGISINYGIFGGGGSSLELNIGQKLSEKSEKALRKVGASMFHILGELRIALRFQKKFS